MMDDADVEALEIQLVLDAIHARYGFDLRSYAWSSIRRRVLAAFAKSGLPNLGEFQHRLLTDAAFFSDVLNALTVCVTEPFRDPGFFRVFRESMVPILRTYPELRIWHSGCSTGEEAYACAIVLEEEGLYDRAQIYATDLNQRALDQAKQGMYAAEQLHVLRENYRSAGGTRSVGQYYTEAYEHFAVRDSLKRNLLFFQHDLVSDQPFAHVHVIFCRNVLIYFNPDLRAAVIDKMVGSLCSGGFLCLGAGETLPREAAGVLTEFAAGERVYRHAR